VTTPDLKALRRDVEALDDDPKLKEEMLREFDVLERHLREMPPPTPPSWGARIYAALRRMLKSEVRAVPVDVDPLAEAEVYVSYGRIDQAIEILEQAHRAHPERQDIVQKLRELRLRVR
jgi:hypothetical protein